jgi:outer membrane immunogenic protein
MSLRTIQKLVLITLFTLSISVFADDKIHWTGFYSSAMIGRDWSNNGGSNGTVDFTHIPNDRPVENWSVVGDGNSFKGWGGNLKFGYNKQLDNNLIGVELGITLQDTKSNNQNIIPIGVFPGGPTDTPYGLFSKTKINTYESLSARIGHIFNTNTLVYLNGGAALSSVKNTVTNIGGGWDTGSWIPIGNISDSKTELGYLLGLGIEYKINQNLALRANYEYVDFGNVNFKYSSLNCCGDYKGDWNISNSIHFSNLSAGVSYAF